MEAADVLYHLRRALRELGLFYYNKLLTAEIPNLTAKSLSELVTSLTQLFVKIDERPWELLRLLSLDLIHFSEVVLC